MLIKDKKDEVSSTIITIMMATLVVIMIVVIDNTISLKIGLEKDDKISKILNENEYAQEVLNTLNKKSVAIDFEQGGEFGSVNECFMHETSFFRVEEFLSDVHCEIHYRLELSDISGYGNNGLSPVASKNNLKIKRILLKKESGIWNVYASPKRVYTTTLNDYLYKIDLALALLETKNKNKETWNIEEDIKIIK